MSDVTDLILADHDSLRRGFVALYDSNGPARLDVWRPLAALLEVHADAEETIFYPALLEHSTDGKAETKDAIKDHNKIRDAIREAESCSADDKAWWDAVGRAREQNSDHMAEEESGALPDFRRNASDTARTELGARFVQFHVDHRGGRGIDTADKDLKKYLRRHPSE